MNMKKQIVYPSLITRLFAAIIDITIFSLITLPITTLIGNKLFIRFFGEYFSKHGIDINDLVSISKYLADANNLGSEELRLLGGYLLLSLSINYIVIGICYCICWFKWGNTLGKAFLHLKIIDVHTMERPTKWQFLKRYYGYILAVFNIFIMPFNQQSRGIQDMLAGTVVIKS